MQFIKINYRSNLDMKHKIKTMKHCFTVYCCKEVNYGVRLFRYFRKVFDDNSAKF